MALCDLFVSKPQVNDWLNDKLVWGGVLLGLVLGGWSVDSIHPSHYALVHFSFIGPYQLELVARSLGAIIIVFAVLRLDLLAKLFETRPLQFLGKISFSLYLLHFIVLCSLSSYIFYKALPAYGYESALLLSSVVGIGVTLFLSAMYAKYVDLPSTAISRRLGNALLTWNPHKLSWLSPWKSPVGASLNIINGLARKKVSTEEAAG